MTSLLEVRATAGGHRRRRRILNQSEGGRLVAAEAGAVCLDQQGEAMRRGLRVEEALWE